MDKPIEAAKRHCDACIEDAWKEFERTGEIVNAAEGLLNAAGFYQKYAQVADEKLEEKG